MSDRYYQQRISDLEAEVIRARAEAMRLRTERDHYARGMDGLAKVVAEQGDGRYRRRCEQAVALLVEVARRRDRDGGSPEDRDLALRVQSFLAELGKLPPRVDELRRAYEEWERRDGNP